MQDRGTAPGRRIGQLKTTRRSLIANPADSGANIAGAKVRRYLSHSRIVEMELDAVSQRSF